MRQAIAFGLFLCALHLAVATIGLSQTGMDPGKATPGGTPSQAGLEVASWLLTIPYGTLKVGFALAGGLVGTVTYAFSGGNFDAAQSVWVTSMYGTYAITPEHLTGRAPVRFLGVETQDKEGA